MVESEGDTGEPDTGERDTGEGDTGQRRRQGERPPWLTSLDPMANLRDLEPVGREGMRRGIEAARGLMDAVLGAGSTSGPLFGADPDAGSGSPADRSAAAHEFVDWCAARSKEWIDLLAAVPVAGRNGAGPELVLDPVAPGEEVRTELSVRNETADDVTDVRMHCGTIRNESADAIDPAAVEFSPAEVDVLHARSSRGLTMTVRVDEGTPAGRYCGVVRASNVADFWVPFSFEVRAAGP